LSSQPIIGISAGERPDGSFPGRLAEDVAGLLLTGRFQVRVLAREPSLCL